MSESQPGKLTLADITGLLDTIQSQTSTEPGIQLPLYAVPCPMCQNEAAVLLMKGFCCDRCAAIHDGERVILKPTHHRKGPSWAFTLDVRNSIRDGKGNLVEYIPAPPITIREMWQDLKRD